VEQPASLIGALNSPHGKSADKRQSLETKAISRGTEGSNPAPSSAESAANRFRHQCMPTSLDEQKRANWRGGARTVDQQTA
jgi:hypothetical protein